MATKYSISLVFILVFVKSISTSETCQRNNGPAMCTDKESPENLYSMPESKKSTCCDNMWKDKQIQSEYQSKSLRGKTIILVGHGGYSKKFTLQTAKNLGIKIVLFSPSYISYGNYYIHRYLNYNFTDHTQDHIHAHRMLNILREENITADGCSTFSDESASLAALLAELLGLTSASSTGTAAAKMKSKTYNLLKMINHGEVDTTSYAVKSVLVEYEKDIDDVIQDLGLPVVLKLEYGSGSVGVQLAKTRDDCFRKYRELRHDLAGSDIKSGMGLGFGQALTFMEYVNGSEHSVDVVIFNGKLLVSFIKDKGPTRHESFLETVSIMPSLLSEEDQERVVQAAYLSCLKLGLRNGVFNVDVKLTEMGPKLLEVNARMGGVYLWSWIKSIYGVDIVLYNYLISCGIEPIIPKMEPKGHVIGTMLLPSVHSDLLNGTYFQNELEYLSTKGVIIFNQFRVNATLCGSGLLEKTYGNIAVLREDLNASVSMFTLVTKWLKISTEDYAVDQYIRDMVHLKKGN